MNGTPVEIARLSGAQQQEVWAEWRSQVKPRVVMREIRKGKVRYRRVREDEVIRTVTADEYRGMLHFPVAGSLTLEFNRDSHGIYLLPQAADQPAWYPVVLSPSGKKDRWYFHCPDCARPAQVLYGLEAFGMDGASRLVRAKFILGCRVCLGVVYRSQAEHKTPRGDEGHLARKPVGSAANRADLREEKRLQRTVKRARLMASRVPGVGELVKALELTRPEEELEALEGAAPGEFLPWGDESA